MSAGTGGLSSRRRNFRVAVEMPQPVPAGVSRKLRLARWGWWGPNAAVLGPAGLHPAPLAPVQLLGG